MSSLVLIWGPSGSEWGWIQTAQESTPQGNRVHIQPCSSPDPDFPFAKAGPASPQILTFTSHHLCFIPALFALVRHDLLICHLSFLKAPFFLSTLLLFPPPKYPCAKLSFSFFQVYLTFTWKLSWLDKLSEWLWKKSFQSAFRFHLWNESAALDGLPSPFRCQRSAITH